MGRRVDVGVRSRFFELLDEGYAASGACRLVGVSVSCGSRWMRKAGLGGRPGRPRLSEPSVVTEGRRASEAARAAGLFDKDDRRARLAGLVLGGASVAAAARQVGLGAGAARRWARAAGVERPSAAARAAAARGERQRVRAELRARAVGLVEAGSTAKAAAGIVGVSESAVCRWAREDGVSLGTPQSVRDSFWDAWRRGASVEAAARAAGIHPRTGARWVRAAGVSRPVSWRARHDDRGMHVDMDAPPGYRLSARERQDIALGRAAGWSVRAIAAGLGRPVSTVSREIARHAGPDGRYRFLDAERAARDAARRPKTAKLAAEGPLRDYVADGLKAKLSPEQIAHRIRLDHPDDPEMRVCHETIYQAIYVQARGGLKQELTKATRRGRTYRQPRRKDSERRGRIPGMVPIAQRPQDVAERLVPGHWEGDLIIGKDSASAVATLVERSFRYTMLGHLNTDHTAPTVRDAIVPLIAALPDQMRKTLTWDQGAEMACHLQVADQADIQVYFADPHSPWQRGTNENTNGLLRQYMPKHTDLSMFSPDDLQAIAHELNNRPRKVLGWLTPTEAWHLSLGHQVTIGGRPAHLPDTLLPLAQRCVDP